MGHVLEVKNLALSGSLNLIQGSISICKQIRFGERFRQTAAVHNADGAGQIVALRKVVHRGVQEFFNFLLVAVFLFQCVENHGHAFFRFVSVAVLHEEQEFVTAPAAHNVILSLETVKQLGEPYQ